MLDLIDKKLLYALDTDCRQSCSQLARKLKIHRNVVLYRIKRLEQEKIIRGYFTEIDIKKLGFHSFRSLIKLSNYTTQEREKFINAINATKEVMWFMECDGRWDIDIVTVWKTIPDFEQFQEQLHIQFNGIIEEEQIGMLMQLEHFLKEYFITTKRTAFVDRKFEETEIAIDAKDYALLRILASNANIGIITLAKKSRLSINTVKERLRKLERNNVILGYRPFINTAATGYTYYKIFITLKHYDAKSFLALKTFFRAHPGVIYFTKYLNGSDLEIEIHLPSRDALQKLEEEARAQYGAIIKDWYVLRFTKEHAYRYIPETF